VLTAVTGGAITTGSHSEEPPPPDTESGLGRLDDSMAGAVAKAEARAHVQRLAEEQAALLRLATLVADGVPPHDVFSAVSDEVAQLFAANGLVLRFEEDGFGIVSVGVSGGIDIPVGTRWEFEEGMASLEVYRTGSSARVDAFDWASAGGPAAETAKRVGIVSSVSNPILVENRLWGAITVLSTSERLLDETEDRLERFSQLVATAIANAESRDAVLRTGQALELVAAEQAALRRVATLVAQDAAPAEIFAAVSAEVDQLFGLDVDTSDVAGVVRFDPGPELLVVGVSRTLQAVPLGSSWEPVDLLAPAHVLRSGRSARVDEDDLATVGGPVADFLRGEGYLSQVASPIVVGGRLWGAISVNSAETLPPDSEDRLEKFTELVAAAIANAESHQALAELAEEQAALRRVATLVARDTSSTEVFDAVATEVAKLFETEITVVGRYDDDGVATAIGNWSASGRGVPVGTRSAVGGHNVLTMVAETGKPARVDGYDGASGEAAEIARRFGWRSSIAAPIVVEDRLWGVMLVATERPEPFPAAAEERLAAFTDLVASAIANTESRTEVEQLAEEQAALWRVATLVAKEEAPEDVLAKVVEETGRLLGGVECTLLRNERDGAATNVGTWGETISAVFPLGARFLPDGDGVAATVLRTGHPHRIDDYAAVADPVARSARDRGIESSVGCPIVVRGAIWGAIVVGTTGAEPFPPETEMRLTQFADLVATAVANAEARGEVLRLADEQAAQRRVATLVAQGVPPAELFAAVTKEVAYVFSGVEPPLIATVIRFDPGPECVLVGASRPYELEPIGSRWAPKDLYVSTRVLRTGRSARVDEVDLESLRGADADVLRLRRFFCQVGSPVVVEGRLWGAMTLNSSEALPPDTDERLESFTELVATAIANAESRESLARLAEEQAALRRVATLVAADASSTEVFEAVATEVGTLLDTDMTIVGRYDGDGVATAIGSWSASGAGVPVGTRSAIGGHNVLTIVAETGKPARVDGYDDASGEAAEIARRYGWRSSIAAPIVVEDRLWGVMLVATRRPEPFPAGAEERLAAFTDLVATAVANTQARQEVAALADEQAALRRVAVLVAQQPSPSEVFTAVTQAVGLLLDADLAVLHVFPGDGAATTIASWSGEGPVLPIGSRFPLDGDNLAARIFESGAPARMYSDDEAWKRAATDFALSLRVRSAVGAPILVEGKLWGALAAASRHVAPWAENAETRIAAFTELVATAIANADARHALERVAAEQATLRRIATLVAEGLQPEEIFAVVIEEVGRLFGTDLTTVGRFEDDPPAFVAVALGNGMQGVELATSWALDDPSTSAHLSQSGRSVRVNDGLRERSAALADMLARLGVASTVSSPIMVEGRLWGAVMVSSKQELPVDTEERLSRFTELVATAVANAENRSELAASRRRIVAASDETRRRIERDLHDGTQQRLVSLGLAVRAAEANLPSERDDLRAQLSGVATGLIAAVEDLQEISRGIHPAILSKGGLAPALQALAHRSAIPVDLDITADLRPEEPIEVAAYFVASEALANAAKHSEASRIDVTLAQRDGSLVLSVRDDGVGGADAARGSGLVGLADRVEALGGSIRVASRPGEGTQITAELPLELKVLPSSG